MWFKYIFTIVILSVHYAVANIEGPANNTVNDIPDNEIKSQRTGRVFKDCDNTFSAKCLKIKALSLIEDLSSKEELHLFPGLSIVKEKNTNVSSPEEIAAELTRQFPGQPDEKINRYLLYRLQDYLDGHSLKYKLLDPQTTKKVMDITNNNKEAGRKSALGGGGKGGGALLAAALMMKGTMAAAALGALALLAGKALMTALMSLLLSALVGLKGGGHKSTTYEIITKPEVSHHHSHSHEEQHEHEHGHGGYRRAYDTDYYNSYMPYDTTNSAK